MPGNYPEESIQHSEHGESLKSRTKNEFSINNMDNTMPIHYLLQSFKSPFPVIELKLLSTREVKKN